jgi:hypothetical protein
MPLAETTTTVVAEHTGYSDPEVAPNPGWTGSENEFTWLIVGQVMTLRSGAGTVWLGSFIFPAPTGLHVGMRFLAPPTPGITEPPVVKSVSVTLDYETVVTPGRIRFMFVPRPNEKRYGLGVLPAPATDELPGTRGEEDINGAIDGPTEPGTVTYNLDPGPLGTNLRSASNTDGSICITMMSDEFADYRIAGVGHLSLNPPSLTMVTIPAHTGYVGGPFGGNIRAVRDTRFGFPAFSHELVRDLETPSLYVRPHDVDPEELEARYRPKAGEGSVSDDIPDLGD